MNNNHQAYIEKRMNELGFKDYHIQPMVLSIESGETIQHIKAYNEYLYLISEIIPSDLIVHSDTNLYFSNVQQFGAYIPQEFSGLVCIESSSQDAFSLEFIRVIPQ